MLGLGGVGLRGLGFVFILPHLGVCHYPQAQATNFLSRGNLQNLSFTDFNTKTKSFKMHCFRPQITHSQLSPITTGRWRHLHDATNFLVVQY